MRNRLQTDVLRTLILAVVYYASARLGLQLEFEATQASPIWPASGIALASLLVFGPRLSGGVFLGAVLANLADFYVKSGAGADPADLLGHFAAHPLQILVSLAIGAGNMLEALTGFHLIHRYLGDRDISSDNRSILVFVAGALVCCIVASAIGVTSLWLASELPGNLAGAAWFTWWLGDATGILVFAPLLLAVTRLRGADLKAQPWHRLAFGFLILILATGLTFNGWFGPELAAVSSRLFGASIDLASFPQAFLLVPILFWITFSHGEIPGKLGVAAVSATAIIGTIGGHGPFLGRSQTQALLLLQTFTAVIAVSVLILDAALRGRWRSTLRVRDVLEERVAESSAALRESEGRFKLLVESVYEYAIILLDPSGVVAQWNAGAERLKGYTAAEILGSQFALFYTEEEQKAGRPRANLISALRSGKLVEEGWRVRKDGSRFWAAVTIEPIRNETGQLLGFAKIVRDMTQRRQTEERLRQAQKMEVLGRLTGGIAHDFNNLLTAIYGSMETLERRLRSVEPELVRYIEMAIRNTERAITLTRQLLAFGRQQALQPQSLDLNRLVSGMSTMLRRVLGESIAIETVLAGGLWRASADSNQLESAILNLAVNARDAMPKGGKLTIETANVFLDEAYAEGQVEVTPGQYAMVAVSDTGAGMSAEVAAQAFEPFFTTKPAGEGTGLGLAQVYGFAKQSGGHVKIYSVPGEGTTVKLYLPRAAVADAEEPAWQEAEIPIASKAETILLVEDDDDVRTHGEDILTELGYRVLTAHDGATAMQALDSEPEVHLLFTDVGLPGGLTGRQLAEAAQRRRPGLKVLFTTGYARNAIVHQGRLDPGVELIAKPFTYAGLAAKIRQVLDQ